MNVEYDITQLMTIRQTIANHACQTPSRTAITAPGRTDLTFQGLLEFVDDIALKLKVIENKKIKRIAIIMPEGPEMAVAFLAIASFAAAAPLNPNYKKSDLEFYLSDLKADALLIHSESDSSARDVANAMNIPVIEAEFQIHLPAGHFNLKSDQCLVSLCEVDAPVPDDIALFLHTSGTTSRPKLVPLTQLNLCTSGQNIINTLGLTINDRCLNIMPLFHIHGLVASLFSSIASGGSVVCTPGLDCYKFFNWLDEYKPTWYTGVPTMHQAILTSTETEIIPANSSLRFIRSSSSALAPQVMADLEATFNVPVIEAYGMTEASHQMASNPLPPKHRKAGSVGLSAGPEIVILDNKGTILKTPERGEIAINGYNVTCGYENNQEANKEAFTNSWFRTGDLGYIDDDGYLFISGRIKEIINRGGEKISPREIDEVLIDHPDVVQAVAFATPHPTLGEDLAAAVVLSKGADTTTQQIRDFLFKKLPGFKVPSQVIILDKIPKGPTGKLQRIGLAVKLSGNLNSIYMPPRNDLEKQIAIYCTSLLKIEKIGINDNFFALGGDSILATQLMSRINNDLTLETGIPAVTVFLAPTIAELADEITKYQTQELSSDSVMEMLAEIENLSDEEVARLLKEEELKGLDNEH